MGKKPMKKSLKEYSNEELYEILNNNESIAVGDLACFCSEVLRRQIQDKRRISRAEGFDVKDEL